MNAPHRIEYDHEVNKSLHTVHGALEALSILLPANRPHSLLDIGCGPGTWLKAARILGIETVRGVDGLEIREDLASVPIPFIELRDLNEPVDLGERFDLVLCMEVAEHIEPENADILVDTISRHGTEILFSAAIPGQAGTHHVNCQWPEYWQEKFNARGFVCDDLPRWQIWNNQLIEPWYRQNLIRAVHDPRRAGAEPRIKPVIHPDALDCQDELFFSAHKARIEGGVLRWPWYVSLPFKAAIAKIRHKLH